jgi:hypothetical protein
MEINKRILISIILIIQILHISIVHCDTNIILKDPVITNNDINREFNISYNFNVLYEQQTLEPNIVLVLDRSNSLLDIDYTNFLRPISKTIYDAAYIFIIDYYEKYPNGKLAIISFGTDSNKENKEKYFTNKYEALEELEYIYTYTKITHIWEVFWSKYYRRGYLYGWNNWEYEDGSTNIKHGFESAVKLIKSGNNRKSVHNNKIILFTDGVATRGGSYCDKDVSNPICHNSNTIAAYEAGVEAQKISDVITVGYFRGTPYFTKLVARDTLIRAQNSGFYEAYEIGEVINVFKDVVQQLECVGTEATVTQEINRQFEVIEDSIKPLNYKIVNDAEGKTIISWDIGNLTTRSYNFSYKIKVKDTEYKLGGENISINSSKGLKYRNLKDENINVLFKPVIVDIGRLTIPKESIINHSLSPAGFTSNTVTVTVDITSDSSIKEYKCLKGDISNIEQFEAISSGTGIDPNLITNEDKHKVGNFYVDLNKENNEDYYYEGNGIYTIYVKDNFNQIVIKKIKVYNLIKDLDDLPNNT